MGLYLMDPKYLWSQTKDDERSTNSPRIFAQTNTLASLTQLNALGIAFTTT